MSKTLTAMRNLRVVVFFRRIWTALKLVILQGFPAAIEHAKSLRDSNPPVRVQNRIHSIVRLEDVLHLDWTTRKEWNGSPRASSKSRFHVAWIMSPPGVSSGGHQNIFRFIDVLEKRGHKCTIYLYDSTGQLPSEESVRELIESSDAYPDVKARIFHYESGVSGEVDAIFATGWETAYPSFNDVSHAKRFYFIQDFEPLFYPLGTDAMLAENTYRFGFHGITAGGWLAHKVSSEYGMTADHFDFAVDPMRYSVTNTEDRDEVFFYARPVTPRRAFEFGLLVLSDLLERRPNTVVNFAGWDTSDWEVPFEYNNLGALALSDLNNVYNKCGAALVLSLSNMSLLPLELVAAGVVPVVNDAPNNRMVSDSRFIAYEPLVPEIMSRRLDEILSNPVNSQDRLRMSESISEFTWNDSGEQFIRAFERKMIES